MTNAEIIRQMTDEELVKAIGLACRRCAYCNVETESALSRIKIAQMETLNGLNRRLRQMTNGDKVRIMTDEELAERFGFEECKDSRYGYECPGWHAEDCGHATCKKYFLKWLKQEVSEDAAD